MTEEQAKAQIESIVQMKSSIVMGVTETGLNIGIHIDQEQTDKHLNFLLLGLITAYTNIQLKRGIKEREMIEGMARTVAIVLDNESFKNVIH